MAESDLAEYRALRARVAELEHRLFPQPVTVDKRDSVRYLLTPGHEEDPRFQRPWDTFQEVFVGSALGYARERHPKLQFHRARRWDEIPEGGLYTTARDALNAKRTQADVQFYEIDKRSAALKALEAQRQRIHDRESDLLKSPPKDRSIHRVWAFRLLSLGQAMRRGTIDRAFDLACSPLTDYDDIVQAVTRAADDTLERDRRVTLETIPGYRPDGTWTCDKCGYPFEDSRLCFTCDACGQADPFSRDFYQRELERVASEERFGGTAAAARLIEAHRERLEELRWVT